MKVQQSFTFATAAILTTAMAACGPEASGVNLAVTVPRTSNQVQDSPTGELVLTNNGNELVIATAEIVLREIEFERSDHSSDCDSYDDDSSDDGSSGSSGSYDDSCGELDAGPRLVSLPLDGSVNVELSADLPQGTYDEIELDVHKVSDSDDRTFIERHADMLEASVRVRGTWNGETFTFTSDVDEEKEIELENNPIVVGPEGSTVGVTLALDVATWFTDGSGNLIDPRTALDGGEYDSIVEENIKNSIDGYEDDDQDGIEDDDDDDDHGES
jgi:hypothetical protein